MSVDDEGLMGGGCIGELMGEFRGCGPVEDEDVLGGFEQPDIKPGTKMRLSGTTVSDSVRRKEKLMRQP